jgi:excisionase family DNA binding protein
MDEHSNGELPQVLTTKQVAELLGLHPRSVLVKVKEGRLPAYRLPGSRKLQYVTSEVLATLGRAPAAVLPETAAPVAAPVAAPAPADPDPCEVWGAAPAPSPGEDWHERCRRHWIGLAREAGLSPVDVTDGQQGTPRDNRSTGAVEIDGLVYEVLVGPRQRTRYVDDDGEVRWGLIDAVWAEPAGQMVS